MLDNIINVVIIANIVKMSMWVKEMGESGWKWVNLDVFLMPFFYVEAQEPRSSNKAVLAWWVGFGFAKIC